MHEGLRLPSQGIRLFQYSQRTPDEMQTTRHIHLHLARPQPMTHGPRILKRLLDGRQNNHLTGGIDGRPFLGEAALHRHALHLLGVDAVVDKVALVARLGERDVCAKDGVVKGGLFGGGAGGSLLDRVEEVNGFGAALLVEDDDAGGGAADWAVCQSFCVFVLHGHVFPNPPQVHVPCPCVHGYQS